MKPFLSIFFSITLNPKVYIYYKAQLTAGKGNARFSVLTIAKAMFASLKPALSFTGKHLGYS